LTFAVLAADLMVAEALVEKMEEGRCWSLNTNESRAVCKCTYVWCCGRAWKTALHCNAVVEVIHAHVVL
jgi:hypothetical protein